MTNNTQASQQARKGFWDVYEPNNHKRIYVTVFNSAEAASYAENGYKVIEQASQQVPSALTDEAILELAWQHLGHASGGMYQTADHAHFFGSEKDVLALVRAALAAKEQTP